MSLLGFLGAPPPRFPIYLIVGKDEFLVELALEHVRRHTLEPGLEEFNHRVLRCHKSMKAGVLVDALAELPMLATVRLLELREADELPAAVAKAGVPGLEQSARDPGVVTVLTASGPPRKDAALLQAASQLGHTVAAEVPEAERPGWLRARLKAHGVRFEPEAQEELLARVGGELRLLETQLTRLGLYAGQQAVTAAMVKDMVAVSASVQIWRLTAAIGQGDLRQAIDVLDRLLAADDSAIGLLGYLNTYLNNMAQTRHVGTSPSALKAAFPGKKDFQLKKQTSEAATWAPRDLALAFESLLKADLRLKTGGESKLVMQMLLMQLCGRQGLRRQRA